ncbi:ReoY family proteolytic degradation factor [Halobacillus litoralis]|uniref:ReoY family proteolytic degradation factor n=1 Tax=Halobacillus litoralis TaxID=45668 RepID=UPI001CD21AA7|nr:ReoY family proteolytic degradation factor [Halobacillus litoralis]MCA0970357.1 ReoY family proteolytic degradation factor [Halobacillus litoralis]
MQTPISVDEKKDFVRWFLNHFQLKKRESVWILNYLMNHESLLSSVHFVNEVKFCPRGMEISAQGVSDPPFRFYKGQVMTNDAEKSFHDLRMNKDEPVYIQMNFEKAQQCSKYALVLEENPYLPKDYYLNDRDKSEANRLLSHSLLQHRLKQTETEIDLALVRGDRETFNDLCQALNQIKKELNAFT